MLNLNIPPWKLFGWFRRQQLWATGDWQLHQDHMSVHTSHLMQSILVKHQLSQVTQPPYRPDLASCDFWLFPKLKSPLKGKKFQTVNKIQENTMGSWWWLGELCEVTRCVLWRGLRFPYLCTLFLVSSSINVSIFHITWLDTFWTDLTDFRKYVTRGNKNHFMMLESPFLRKT